jgi:GTP-binding protein Era
MKSGFVNIFGKPNAGKSTLLNALLGEKLAIVSPKVQTTRHRIKAFINKENEYQIILSDTPGIIDPKYKLHEKMMLAVKSALEDADIALLLIDVSDDIQDNIEMFSQLKLKVPSIVILNKVDKVKKEVYELAIQKLSNFAFAKNLVTISALNKTGLEVLLQQIVNLLPEGEAFYNEDDLTDLPTKFFVGEMIREKIYELFHEEIPYQTAIMVNEFKEKSTLIKIQADIIVNRESQKAILIGDKGSMIKSIGSLARKDIEEFLQQKVFLELFIKVKPKWRDNDLQLKEYGYH